MKILDDYDVLFSGPVAPEFADANPPMLGLVFKLTELAAEE